MSEISVERLAHHRLKRLATRSLARVDEACRDGHGWSLWLDHVDGTAEIMASTAYLAHLAERPEVSFWAIPEEVQADVVLIGCDFADLTRNSFDDAIEPDPEILAELWRYAAGRFQAHVDRLLLSASHCGGRA